jgi:DNA (cytosine-5)-methyltransferase 1
MGAMFDQAWLRAQEKFEQPNSTRVVSLVDLFSGCGGLSVGIREACRALGHRLSVRLANDIDRGALAVYAHNLSPEFHVSKDVKVLFNGKLGRKVTIGETNTLDQFQLVPGQIDFLVGGPPCQGHSDLNNRTRRDDPKNSLYARMARAAEVLRPHHVIIENVPGVRHDRSGIAEATRHALEQIKEDGRQVYQVQDRILHGTDFGVPQTRRRYFLVATRGKFDFDQMIEEFKTSERSLEWAIGDLLDAPEDGVYNKPSMPTQINQSRMNWFFTKKGGKRYDLPNWKRPDCHKHGDHSYVGVYGRMRWDTPAPTITGGFGCAGQGRFTHPLPRRSQGRTLTPHEAARVQFFPDFFDFSPLWTKQLGGRKALHQMIGNAVPPKFAYVLGLALLRAERC